MNTLKVGVGACTRDRPYMFKALLRELAKQAIPPHVEASFIFVENDADISIAETVDGFRRALVAGGLENPKICIEPEPRAGIRFARDRMLEIALHLDLDYLAVLDDDVYPADGRWLGEMVAGIHARQLDVAHGPVRIEPLGKEELSSLRLIPRMVYKSLAGPDEAERVAPKHRGGSDRRILLGESNVIFRLSWIRERDIRFNDRPETAHGEERRMGAEIKHAGGKAGVVPKALAYIRLSDERLSLKAQFRLCRSARLARHGKQRPGLFGAENLDWVDGA